MENNSDFSTFIMTGFGEMENMKYLYSLCTLLGYLIILSLNLLLIVVIALEESLHKPMYILICNLAVNGVYGSTAFFPKLIADLLSDIHTISRAGCLTQVFFVHTTAGVEITILAVMAYDRFVCVCNPLRYTSIVTYSTLSKLISVTQHRFDIRNVPHSLRVIMSVQYLIIPPLLNPIIYGVRTQEIKRRIIKKLRKRVVP
nr:PREDICTED: olfactory receptor 51E1-like [Latimeria chalumnae]|eukprot:XP_014352379.1 PREDICTED: olfactory receptor 51E1-like [Latimeria chalumnae]